MSNMDDNETKDDLQDPSVVFTKSVMGQIQREDVISMVEAQREMLSRYEKTNEMLLNFNMLSSSRYGTTMLEFKQHTDLLYEMKKDLDAIFRRIRVIKGRLSSLYPEAFTACGDVYYVPEESDGEKSPGDKMPGETAKNESESKMDKSSETATAGLADESSKCDQTSGEVSVALPQDSKKDLNAQKT